MKFTDIIKLLDKHKISFRDIDIATSIRCGLSHTDYTDDEFEALCTYSKKVMDVYNVTAESIGRYMDEMLEDLTIDELLKIDIGDFAYGASKYMNW